jgi:O-antigen/teichoic acid export membrane protein
VKNKLATRILSSGLQAIAVQVLGSAFFYFISIYLSKEDFGIINWGNAVSLFLTVFLGFGLEQVVIRRIAASNRSDWAAAAFFMHAVVGFLITFLLLLTLSRFIKAEANTYKVLPWFFLVQGLIYVGVPLKQFLNAKEKFTPYGIIAIISNVSKIIAAFVLLKNHALNIHTVIIILICTAAFELCGLVVYLVTKTDFSFKLKIKAYIKLIKEASTQYISVIFDMSLSRMDWILLGVMTSNAVLADYSFAYRAFEIARLPLLIIAPIILPRLARLLSFNSKPGTVQQLYINSFSTIETFFAMLIPLALNILWVPLITLITKGKYGDTNSLQFLMLSLCIPLQFFINLLWSVCFAAKKYKSVSSITIICAVTNIMLNLILIPRLQGPGAAIAFFVTTLLQGCLYYRLVYKQIMIISPWPIMFFAIAAVVIYFFTTYLNVQFFIQLIIAIALYVLFALLSKMINKQHITNFKHFLS